MNRQEILFENIKSYVCEYLCDGYDDYVRALYECGFTKEEILKDLDGCMDAETEAEISLLLSELSS